MDRWWKRGLSILSYGEDAMLDTGLDNRKNMLILLERIEKLERKVSESEAEIDLLCEDVDALIGRSAKETLNNILEV